MCGLIGFVLAYDARRHPVDLAPLRALAAQAATSALDESLEAALEAAESVSESLVLWRGFRELFLDSALAAEVAELSRVFNALASAIESALEQSLDNTEAQRLGARALRVRDVAWRLEQDAVGNVARARSIGATADDPDKLLFERYRLTILLNNLARLEVRGRDSGGVAVTVTLSAASAAEIEATPALATELRRRQSIADFRHGAVRATTPRDGCVSLCFAHKVAKEVGRLGANIEALRESLEQDALLAAHLRCDDAIVSLLGHNRWASNGIINEANCHPLIQELDGDIGRRPRLIMSALNGDIDNYPVLRQRHLRHVGRDIAAGITTDAKIIPIELERQLNEHPTATPLAAFRASVADFEGSFAIASQSSTEPGELLLAQRGSGQGLFVGVAADGGQLFASELYGIVELCDRYYRLDGSDQSGGEVMALTPGRPPVRAGLGGESRPFSESLLSRARITTRDINKAGFEHYLLKEINEAPRSVKKTLRGRITRSADDGSLELKLGPELIPPRLEALLDRGALRQVFVIGQGTASIAAGAIADALERSIGPKGVSCRGLKATELSGFQLDAIGEETLVVAVSQSGTTTDTNRTVDLCRERGAIIVAIVNRRGSDLTTKSEGVIYTSDGRDIEMSVASTKAFYCQVVAGYLLTAELARRLGALDDAALRAKLGELTDLPRRLEEVLAQRDRVRAIARNFAGSRRHWAVVGSGSGRRAAAEVRIKLSELCYKSIPADTIEDKKHIDLSAESLVFVCAAGLTGANARDAVKEVAIFKAHQGIPIVVCDRGETRFAAHASAIIEVPPCSPEVSLLLNTAAGHLFGYYAALALDQGAASLRVIRELLEAALLELSELERRAPGEATESLARLRSQLAPLARPVFDELRAGRLDSGLPAALAFKLAEGLRLALGQLPLEVSARYTEAPGVAAMLRVALGFISESIEHMMRPIDAIKHQAKTVTVGISRERARRPVSNALTEALAAAGVGDARLDDTTANALAAFSPFATEVRGCTCYKISGLSPLGRPTPDARLEVVAKTGCAAQMRSRADHGAPLSGTKRKVVSAPRLHVGRGLSDGRSLLIVPLYDAGRLDGLALLHVRYRAALTTHERVQALRIAGRYEDLRALVTEQRPRWRDEDLVSIEVGSLLGDDPARLAEALLGAGDPLG